MRGFILGLLITMAGCTGSSDTTSTDPSDTDTGTDSGMSGDTALDSSTAQTGQTAQTAQTADTSTASTADTSTATTADTGTHTGLVLDAVGYWIDTTYGSTGLHLESGGRATIATLPPATYGTDVITSWQVVDDVTIDIDFQFVWVRCTATGADTMDCLVRNVPPGPKNPVLVYERTTPF